MSTLNIFVSHSHEDDAFCRHLVAALRGAGADVWYDEQNMGSGRLGPVIEQELRTRPVFVLVLSPQALASRWVEDECRWAYGLLRREPTRTILPVLAARIAEDQNLWLFLQDFKRVEAPGVMPYPVDEAVRRTLLALALTPQGEAAASVAPQPTESPEDLVTRGKALGDQGQHAEAIVLLERAAALQPDSFDAWINLGYHLGVLDHIPEALIAFERAWALQPDDITAEYNRGHALVRLDHHTEALAAFERVLGHDPTYELAWNGKGNALMGLDRHAEALAAYEQATALDPIDPDPWNGSGNALFELGRFEEALVAYDHSSALNPEDADPWYNKALVLRSLGRLEEADAAEAQSTALGG